MGRVCGYRFNHMLSSLSAGVGIQARNGFLRPDCFSLGHLGKEQKCSQKVDSMLMCCFSPPLLQNEMLRLETGGFGYL